VSTRWLFVAGYCSVLVAGLGLELAARRGRAGLATSDAVFTRIQRHRAGRAAAFALWFWTGFHFLAR
jgi:hypothetical protein